MSFVRGFSVRRKSKVPEPVPGVPSRSVSVRTPLSSGSIRHKISAPTKLLSTTNLLTTDTADIFWGQTPRSSINSADSDSSMIGSTSSFTSPDSSSIESASPVYPEPNHLSCYFGCPTPGDTAPSIPRRSPSHTTPKRSVDNFLSRRLTSRLSSSSRKTKLLARSSFNVLIPRTEVPDHVSSDLLHRNTFERAHPHGECQPVLDTEQEELELISRGLQKFRAEDYVNEIHGIYIRVFDDLDSVTDTWI